MNNYCTKYYITDCKTLAAVWDVFKRLYLHFPITHSTLLDSKSTFSSVLSTVPEIYYSLDVKGHPLYVLYRLCLCSGQNGVCRLVDYHMQLTTLLEPWPTSLIWLMWEEQTATPAPARQWETEPTSSHLNKRRHTEQLVAMTLGSKQWKIKEQI